MLSELCPISVTLDFTLPFIPSPQGRGKIERIPSPLVGEG